MTSYKPVTIDGRDVPADAPRSQGMDDGEHATMTAFADAYRDVVMHLHSDVVGRDVDLTAANCPPGLLLIAFGDGTAEVEERVAEGETPTVSHTYLRDGVFTATLRHENGQRAALEIPVNWPPYNAEAPA